MAQMKNLLVETFNAAAVIANKFRFVIGGAGEMTVQVAGAGARAIGINIDKADAIGKGVAVATIGTCKVEAGAAFGWNVPLKPDATGRAIACATGNTYSGISRGAALAAGDIVECKLEGGVSE